MLKTYPKEQYISCKKFNHKNKW